MRVHFIVHGGRKAASKAEAYLAAHQISTHVFAFSRTTRREDVAVITQKIRAEADLLVVIGGDGLLSLCVKALLSRPGKIPILAIIPSGSGNDFARNFGWKKSASDFVERLSRWEIKWIDTGIVESALDTDYFVNETSSGISNAVVQLVDQKPPGWNGNLKFGMSILQAFAMFRKRTYELRWEGGSWRGKAMLVACCNGRFFGSGIGIAPEAKIDDGVLEVVVIGNINMLHYLRFLPQLKRSEKIIHPEVHYFKTNKIEFLSAGKLERDGEPGIDTPAMISLQPKSIQVLV